MSSNSLKIAQVCCVYNEIDILPKQIKYIKTQGLTPYVLDNYSTDGTFEWLKENNIWCEQFDTKGTFNLEENHNQMLKLAKNLEKEYQWVYFADADLFPVTVDFTIQEIVELAEKHNKNCVFSRAVHLVNTGEVGEENMFTKYNRANGEGLWLKIVKIRDLEALIGDGCAVKPMNYVTKLYDNEVVLFNYGNVKSLEDRKETFARRRKAWKNGLNKDYGKAYPIYAKTDWIYKDETFDINKTHKEHIEKLRDIVLS